MHIKNYILLLIVFTLLITSCSFDDLLSSDDSPQHTREPRDRREPTEPDDNEPGDTPSHITLYLPLKIGAQWRYDVRVTQKSSASDYRVEYTGEESWTCAHVNWQDSTCTFATTFAGDKTILSSGSQNQFTESTSAIVTAKIKNGRLILVEENGTSISPFLGDWLFLLKKNFRVCFDGDQFYENNASFSDVTFLYKLEKNVGLLNGRLKAVTAYEETEIIFTLIGHP